MLEGVISSKTKVNLFVKLFLNPETRAYLRELASEFNMSTNAVRTELNILKKNKILVSQKDGRNIYYSANRTHPLFPELSSIVRKITGIDSLVNSIVERLGNLKAVYLAGDYARGVDAGIIDVILVGNVNKVQLDDVIMKTERYIGRKIRGLVLEEGEFDTLAAKGGLNPVMMLWKSGSNEAR
ncbi:MAG: winged helix-turn-helix transcriptional regulator [Nitrospirae bacterium]|nr:winged helix-turn-helix transcriptional regulator [Nitrospirota bacterium]